MPKDGEGIRGTPGHCGCAEHSQLGPRRCSVNNEFSSFCTDQKAYNHRTVTTVTDSQHRLSTVPAIASSHLLSDWHESYDQVRGTLVWELQHLPMPVAKLMLLYRVAAGCLFLDPGEVPRIRLSFSRQLCSGNDIWRRAINLERLNLQGLTIPGTPKQGCRSWGHLKICRRGQSMF